MSNSPNVLVLMNDQHRPDVLGYAGDDVVRTPTLDWLAETGTVFTNAYTPAPVCVPARHSVRTGQLPRTWSREGFEAFESHDYPTLPLQFGRHGYATASGGKEHYPGWNQHQGWRKRLGPTPMKQLGVGADMVPDPVEGAFESQSGMANWKWSGAKELERAGIANSRTQVQDRRVTDGVCQYVREFFSSPYYDRAQPETPLLLKTSCIQPHYPYFSEHEERFTYYLNRVEPIVESSPAGDHPVLDGAETEGECRIVEPEEDVSVRAIRRATAAYYAMVETVDELFGRVIEALRHNGQDPDEWVIVFTADHGELLGDRGMWGKGQFVEASARVPLIVRYPERFDAGTVEENVNLCDLYATLCDCCNVGVPDGFDSRSMVPLMRGETARWHDEYDNETIVQDVGNAAVRNGVSSDHCMIKRDDLKYCYYGERTEDVLFDVGADPDETTNLIDDPVYADRVDQFRDRLAELGYGPDARRDYRDAGYDAGVGLV
jgi:choline-sulfatase